MFWQRGAQSPKMIGDLQQWPCDGRPVVLVTLLEANDDRRTRALRDHRGARPWLPVFLTTDADLRPLIATGHPVEHLPDPALTSFGAEALDWSAYLQQRWRRVHQKWCPRWTVEYGSAFAQYLIRQGNRSTL